MTTTLEPLVQGGSFCLHALAWWPLFPIWRFSPSLMRCMFPRVMVGYSKFFVMFVDKPLGNPIGILESPDLLVKALFHVLVGLGMAVVFAEVLYPQGSRWGLRGWVIGLWYGVFIWILNAFVVLPSLGEGIAGLRSVGTRGVVVFAVAHFAFFLVLGVTYSALFRTTWRQSSRQPR
jgi:hypothetical protein